MLAITSVEWCDVSSIIQLCNNKSARPRVGGVAAIAHWHMCRAIREALTRSGYRIVENAINACKRHPRRLDHG